MHASPYLLRTGGDESDEAFMLGVMSSIPFDWYARRIVELHMTFELVGSMPIPREDRSSAVWQRTVQIAGTLAAKDARYEAWAASVGVRVGTIVESQRAHMFAELDALVSHLYGLDRSDVEHIFETFHRGWNYQPRLDAVLAHFDRIEHS